MEILIDVILKAGRSAVELSLFILLPIMVVMLSLMRLLEARGALDWLVAKLAPVLRPLGRKRSANGVVPDHRFCITGH